MAQPQRPTLETTPTTSILLVGPTPELLEATQRAAQAVPSAEIVSCELKEAATRVAELWPFAIVMTDDLYAFDSAEFDALARDVQARLITVADATNANRIERKLRPQLVEAFRRRQA
jgi:hypothetical protein